jgi:hypothetical protein
MMNVIVLQYFSNTSVEGFKNEPAGFDSPNNTYNIIIFIRTKVPFNKSQDSYADVDLSILFDLEKDWESRATA